MPKFFARQYFFGVFALMLACSFLLQCKPRRTFNNFSSDDSGDVCKKLDQAIGKAACDSAFTLQALQEDSNFFLDPRNSPDTFEQKILMKIQTSPRYDEQLSYLGLLVAGISHASFRIAKKGNIEDSINKFQTAMQSVITNDREKYWTPEAKKIYKICPDPIQCSSWDMHVFSVQGRVPELYDTFIQLAQDIAEDLYSDNLESPRYQTPETLAAGLKMMFDLRALETEFLKITNFEGVSTGVDSIASHFKSPGADLDEIRKFKNKLNAKLKLYRNKFLDETSSKETNTIKGVFSAAYENEMRLMSYMEEVSQYENPEDFKEINIEVGKDFENRLKDGVLSWELSLLFALADMQALSWYCDRIDEEDYEKIKLWMQEKIDLVKQHKDVSTYGYVLPYTSLHRLVIKFLKREVELPSIEIFMEAVDALQTYKPTVGYYRNEYGEGDFNFSQMAELQGIKQTYGGSQFGVKSYVQRRREDILKKLVDLGIPNDAARRLVEKENSMTKHRGFHSLRYQVYQLQQATQNVILAQQAMSNPKAHFSSKKEVESASNTINEASNEVAAKSLNLLCLDYYYSNNSKSVIKAELLQMNTEYNPWWCGGGSSGDSVWSGKAANCPLQKDNNLKLNELCPRYSEHLKMFNLEKDTFECVVDNKIVQSCAQLNHQLALTVISTLALPGVGSTASALTRLTFAAGRRLVGGAAGMAIQASRAAPFLGWLLHTSVEGAYFGIVNTVLISPLVGIQTAFYDKNKSLYENGVATLKSYLWSFAFFGFSRHMDNISRAIHKKTASSLIGLRLKMAGRNKPEVTAYWNNYLRLFKRGKGDRVGAQLNELKLDDFVLQKKFWTGELNTILPPSYKLWSSGKNTSRFLTELGGFRAIEVVDHQSSPYFDQLMGLESIAHSELQVHRDWAGWTQEQATALTSTLSTVLAFRVKFWHHTYDRKILKPLVLPAEARLDRAVQNYGPLFRYGVGPRKALEITRNPEAHKQFLETAARYREEKINLLRGDLEQLKPRQENEKLDPNIRYVEQQIINITNDYESLKNYDKIKKLANDVNKF